MFLSAIESITHCDSLNTACAAVLSPASIALRTFLIAVRKLTNAGSCCGRVARSLDGHVCELGRYWPYRYPVELGKARDYKGVFRPLQAASAGRHPGYHTGHESAPRSGHRQRDDPAVPHSGLRARLRHRQNLRRRHDDGRLLRRLPPAQPAAPPVCRRRLFAGLRPDPGRIPQSSRRKRDQEPGRSRRQRTVPRPGRRQRARRGRRAGADCRDCARFQRRCGQVPADRRTDPDHLSLHPVHVAGGAWPPAFSTPGAALPCPPSRRSC